jgi:hydroxymethylpyrimidine/phosphomethylpyrimidine kinase
MPKSRPTVLSFAGFDPSGGAGILADIKTMEANKVYGMAVPTALTWQNESEFESVEWITVEKIISQAELLFKKSDISFVKIGLVQNAAVLSEIVQFLSAKVKQPKIIWDPILKASAGFDFHTHSDLASWTSVLPNLFMITPNWDEVSWLSGGLSGADAALSLASHSHVFLKGGHRPDKLGYDTLFLKKGDGTDVKQVSFRPKTKYATPKHGSGCVLSSALTALTARGYPLQRACLMAKQDTANVLESNAGLLGWHKM